MFVCVCVTSVLKHLCCLGDLCFQQSNGPQYRVRCTSFTHRLESALGTTPGYPGNQSRGLFPTLASEEMKRLDLGISPFQRKRMVGQNH